MFAVAMMAAAHADVVIDIEERPIVKIEVNFVFFVFISHFTASSRKGETPFISHILENTSDAAVKLKTCLVLLFL